MSHFLYIRHLLVKNVVMPSAMVVKYRGMGSEGVQYVAGSELTRDRATVLLGEWVKLEEELGMRYALPVAREMKRGLEDDEGTFGAFANKWGYAAEERAAGVESLGRACGDVL